MRTYSIDKVSKAVDQYAEEVQGFEPVEWLSNLNNVALTNKNNDIALFERHNLNPVSVFGHYFFWSRGRDALNAAQVFLREIFTGPYNVEMIVGLTPVTHKGALWMNKQLRFNEIGELPLPKETYKMVMLTKKEWEQQ